MWKNFMIKTGSLLRPKYSFKIRRQRFHQVQLAGSDGAPVLLVRKPSGVQIGIIGIHEIHVLELHPVGRTIHVQDIATGGMFSGRTGMRALHCLPVWWPRPGCAEVIGCGGYSAAQLCLPPSHASNSRAARKLNAAFRPSDFSEFASPAAKGGNNPKLMFIG